jgi:superfamily II DNA or RNA helicase/HKD family nuclease
MIKALEKSLQSGYIDRSILSDRELLPQFLVNDKMAGVKILTTIDSELKRCDEFWFSVAFLTKGGLATLKNTFSELEKKGIKGKILVSQYLNFTQPEALRELLRFTNIELKIAIHGNFHSKGYLFKKGNFYNLIIGSSNLTDKALCSNKEWNLKISATENSHIISAAFNEFDEEFKRAKVVDESFITKYNIAYLLQKQSLKKLNEKFEESQLISPNTMQQIALQNILSLRNEGCKKALLISATGTGKTYLSAFDVKTFYPDKFLFIVHRENIAKAAMKSYQKIFNGTKSMGLYTGNIKEIECDFLFSTVQTISKVAHLKQFRPDYFDYIVIDESHRAGANTYQSILNYFTPKFLLGMTATPERTDDLDIFQLFDYNIAYEIRLHQALEEEMLSPFHYYGVTDISVDGELLKEKSDFKLLTAPERINHIIEKANFYGCDDGKVRGLVFCSAVDECRELSMAFNSKGYNTIALTGSSTELERAVAIERLESDANTIDYIFTVDIFNEGIDIPKVNQVIMLRPTQSAIIFIQQLGRGLRKAEGKEYLTVIDFIGNYNNNYLVPIALYGDKSYNKDTIRNLMTSGSNLIPGCSTINFDKISRDKIFQAIDSANLQLKKDLINDYKLLKSKLGRTPMMIDFVNHSSRDPQLYVSYARSYYNFLKSIQEPFTNTLTDIQVKLLELFSSEINNSKRVEESILLNYLLAHNNISKSDFQNMIFDLYGYKISDETTNSIVNNLNFNFATENHNGQLLPLSVKYDLRILEERNEKFYLSNSMKSQIENPVFKAFLRDSTDYAISNYSGTFRKLDFENGFVLYRKYSRKDVFRILNWEKNPLAQNVGGYIISPDKTNCPIFVNYHKEDDISSTTKYEDHFLSNSEFAWMSKSNRTLSSNDVSTIKNQKNLRLPLFIKKSNDEGTEFYYMGEMTPVIESFEQSVMSDDNGKKVSVVKVRFLLNRPVKESLYHYLTNV